MKITEFYKYYLSINSDEDDDGDGNGDGGDNERNQYNRNKLLTFAFTTICAQQFEMHRN